MLGRLFQRTLGRGRALPSSHREILSMKRRQVWVFCAYSAARLRGATWECFNIGGPKRRFFGQSVTLSGPHFLDTCPSD